MSFKIKIRPGRIGAHLPLPRRNRREALVKRTAALISNDGELYEALKIYPPYMRDAYLKELWPYLRFTPRMPTPVED